MDDTSGCDNIFRNELTINDTIIMLADGRAFYRYNYN